MISKRKKNWHMDVTINGVGHRDLDTTDRREALALGKEADRWIQQGKGVSKSGREFAREPFTEAADIFLEERKPTSRNGLCSLSGIC
jgi:hypothetical protein